MFRRETNLRTHSPAAAFERRRLLNGDNDVLEASIGVVTTRHSSPESSPIASSERAADLVGTNDGAKLKEGLNASFGVLLLSEGVFAAIFFCMKIGLEIL